jgi:beta-phosphoglucomutase family hydrolase
MTETTLKAVIWDLDGVIADTGIYHYLAWCDVFGKRGVNFPKEEFMSHFGRRHDTIIIDKLGSGLSAEEFEAITNEKQENYRRRVSENIRPLPGAISLIKLLREQSLKVAIASSAPLENIEIIIRGLGVEEYFDAIACGTEVVESKPDPQIFLLAAKKLGIKPANCVVIEDAIAGVAAAKSAGMKCVAVTNSHPAKLLTQADLVVASLETVNIETLQRLFNPAKR